MLDRAVSEAYLAQVRPLSGAIRAQFAQEQRDWLALRNACGDGFVCLEAQYRARLPALARKNTPAAVAVHPSFDCSGALSPVEQTICGNAVLAGLDQQVATHYGRLAAVLGAEQQGWSATRGNGSPGATAAAGTRTA